MKSITEQLFEQAKGIIEFLPEVSDNEGKYHMADSGGIESEIGEFLYGMIKVLQPDQILETGTYTGISAMYMAAALKDNNRGHITTLEITKEHKDRAEKLWQAVDLSAQITCELQPSLDFDTDTTYGFMFLDSEPDIRFQELLKFFPYLKPGGFIGVHDLHRHLGQHDNKEHGFGWPWGKIPTPLVELLLSDQLRVVSFPTPRGFTLFYRPKEDDYKA